MLFKIAYGENKVNNMKGKRSLNFLMFFCRKFKAFYNNELSHSIKGLSCVFKSQYQ